MSISRRKFLGGVAIGIPAVVRQLPLYARTPSAEAFKYVRFQHGESTGYGRLKGTTVHGLRGGLFANPNETGKTYPLEDVKLLTPCEPSKVLAVGFNYGSHLGNSPKPTHPELFFKSTTSLLEPGGTIIIPPGTQDCHYEGELVIVVGKKAQRVSVSEARDCIFGVTCGNDVSARDWQSNDLQWWRAKGSDTFAPMGPAIARGINYNSLQLTTRLNGQVKQQQTTADLIFNVETILSYASQYVTLFPGDVIFTGTPGQTSAMKPGDVAEIEIEGVGILRNKVG